MSGAIAYVTVFMVYTSGFYMLHIRYFMLKSLLSCTFQSYYLTPIACFFDSMAVMHTRNSKMGLHSFYKLVLHEDYPRPSSPTSSPQLCGNRGLSKVG